MKREHLARLLTVAALLAGGWWLSVNTEWVDEDSPRPAQGEARDNPVYAFEQLLRRLGMTVEQHEAFGGLPPERARLVLLSSDWALVPERGEQLHQWVLRGGHLVLVQGSGAAWDETVLKRWVPVDVFNEPPPPQPQPQPSAISAMAPKAADTSTRRKLASSPALWDGTAALGVCELVHWNRKLLVKPGQRATWTLTRAEGTPATQAVLALQRQALQALEALHAKQPPPDTQALRLPVGQGSVTVLNADAGLSHNDWALRCDNPLLLAAAVQAEPGATAWIYLNEKRDPLLPWLWQGGWVAIVAGLLALAAALWRAAVRFGPRLAPAPRLRRSISEQVRGLGAYLQRGSPDALLAAQQRALDEVAARTLPRYARLPAAEKGRAIAAATGLAADELATAMSTRFCTRAELPQHLQLLEAARRRLHRTPDERRSP